MYDKISRNNTCLEIFNILISFFVSGAYAPKIKSVFWKFTDFIFAKAP
jgi:hypothetical protein